MLSTTKILDIMSAPAVTASKTNTLTELRKLLHKNSINHMPIVDEANLPVGMVSAMDLSRLSDWRTHFKALAHAGEERDTNLFDSLLAEEIMIQPVITVSNDALVKDAADLIEKHRIHCIPVVDQAGKLVGIVTAHDLLRLAYNTLVVTQN